MPYREIIAVCSEIHTEHINTLREHMLLHTSHPHRITSTKCRKTQLFLLMMDP